jgi:hypothetical protein
MKKLFVHIKRLCVIIAVCIVFPMFLMSTDDPCNKVLPKSLKKQLAKEYPGTELPKISDSAQEDVAYNIRQGGTGCIRVAVGDFNGDHKDDYVIILYSPKHNKATLLVALATVKNWQLIPLLTWQGGKDANYFVGTVPPGEYQAYFGDEGDTEPCLAVPVDKIKAKTEGFEFGITESSGTVYFLDGDKWYSVWISD